MEEVKRQRRPRAKATEVKDKPPVFERVVKALVTIAAAVVPKATKKESKATMNPHAGMSNDMLEAERNFRNEFGEIDDGIPEWKRNRLANTRRVWNREGFSTHQTEVVQSSDAPQSEREGGFWS